MARGRDLALNLLLVLVSGSLCALALEGGTRLYLHFSPQPPNNRYAFRRQQPPPYRDAPYFSHQFIDESFRQPNGWIIPEGSRLVLPGAFDGTYIHVEQGKRRTTDVPPAPRHTLFLLGGSTVYGAEAPDEYTIASCLQRLLNARDPGVWRVENRGSISLTTSQQVELLQTLDVHESDVVVFYDGVNDVVQGVYNADPSGWIVGENRKALQGAGPFRALLARLNLKYAASKAQNYSAFLGTVVNGMVNSVNLRPKPHLADRRRVDELSRQTADQFRRNLEQAAALVHDRRARFFHFLQPQIFASSPRTQYEEALAHNYYLNPNGLEIAFTAAYPLLREVGTDLSHVLDRRAPGEEFYLDYCHVNHAANLRIAAAIFASVLH